MTGIAIIFDSELELPTNFGNSTSKLDSLEDIELPEHSLEGFIDIVVKWCNHVIERELVFFGFVDFDFSKKANFSFVEELENLGCINASDKVYAQIV